MATTFEVILAGQSAGNTPEVDIKSIDDLWTPKPERGDPIDYDPLGAVSDELKEIKRVAEEAGAEITVDRKVESKRRGFSYGLHFTEIKDIVTYGFGSAAALAIFLKNVVSTLKTWREIKPANRTITVKIRGEEIGVKSGDDIAEIVRRWEDDHNS